MKCLVILSHLMTKNCKLGVETEARCRFAINKFLSNNYEFLITMGWAYRKDCKLPISDVVKNFLIENSEIDYRCIISLSLSRDTVGDAYYCFEYLQNTNVNEIHIVTSDYHVNRTNIIFKRIFNNTLNIKVYGVQTDSKDNKEILINEIQSLDAFNKTFALTNFSEISSIYNTLSKKHPFYNGKVYSKISK